MNVWCHNPEFHKSRIDKSPAIEKYFNEYFDEMKIIHRAKTGAGKSWYFYASDLIINLERLYNSGKTIYKI